MGIIEFPLPICGAVVLSSSVSYCMSGNNIVIVLDLFFIFYWLVGIIFFKCFLAKS